MYSQRDEERIILELLSDCSYEGRGVFLDVGAFDGKSFSNTRRLWELGWVGTMVEASPHAFCKLVEEYGNLPGVNLILGTVVSRTPPVIPLMFSKDAVSTATSECYDKWKSVASYIKIYTATLSIESVLGVCGKPDFVSIDTEGTSMDLFRSFLDLGPDRFNPYVVCVEHDGAPRSDIGTYKLVHVTDENFIYRRDGE